MVRQNFVERIQRQSESEVRSILCIDEFDSESEGIPAETDGALWNVQLYRSITSESASFDLKRSVREPAMRRPNAFMGLYRMKLLRY